MEHFYYMNDRHGQWENREEQDWSLKNVDLRVTKTEKWKGPEKDKNRKIQTVCWLMLKNWLGHYYEIRVY